MADWRRLGGYSSLFYCGLVVLRVPWLFRSPRCGCGSPLLVRTYEMIGGSAPESIGAHIVMLR